VGRIDALLSDPLNRVLVTDDGSALLVDWYDWDAKPHTIVEMRFRDGWVPIECDVQAFRCTVGRDLTFEQVEAGRAEISLDNRSGQFTNFVNNRPPINESTEVRLRLRHPTKNPDITHGEKVIWWGQVSNWEQEWTQVSDVVIVEAVDTIGLLSEQGGALGWRSGSFGDTPANRLRHLVNRVGLSRMHTYFEEGHVQLVDPRLRSETVLDAAHNVALSDGGHFFSEVDHLDQRSVVYLDRRRFGTPPIDIGGYVASGPPSPTTMRNVPPERYATTGLARPGQKYVPIFTDRCDANPEGLPYTDLVWAYRGWEMPSVVAVSNVSAPDEVDADGNDLPPAWPEVGHIALGQGRRHNVIEYTGLEFYKPADAKALGELYAYVLSRSRFDVSVLEVYPETDERLWDVVTTLRQGDWVRIERNLQTDRIMATCTIEGIEFSLVGLDDRGPQWKVTYKLSSVEVHTTDIPEVELPPRPPGFPNLRPPLIPIEEITLAAIGEEAAPGIGVSSFVERGDPYNVFELSILDPRRPQRHQAFAFHDEFGLVELPLIINRTYTDDAVRRQFGGVMLAPGSWLVYVTDGTNRRSNQLVISIPEWDDIELVPANLTWNPKGESVATYTDGRYPPFRPRVFVKGADGDIELPVVDWQPVGDILTTEQFTVRFRTSQLPPGEYDLWIQDSGVARRRSELIRDLVVLPTVPGIPTLAPFDAQDWDAPQWDKIGIRWDPVPGVTRYRIQYREFGSGLDWRNTSEEAPFHLLDGGDSNSNGQREKLWEVRVAAESGNQISEYTPPVVFATGYAYLIRKTDYVLWAGGRVVSKGDVFGVTVPSPYCPPWAQSVDPDGKFADGSTSFVGIDLAYIEYVDMRSFLMLLGWSANVAYPAGSLVGGLDAEPGFYAVFRNDEPVAAGGKPPHESGSGWSKVSRFFPTPVGSSYYEATSLRWLPEDVGNLEVKYLSHELRESVDGAGGTTGPGETVRFTFDFISGRGGGASPNYGLGLAGTWWGEAPAETEPALGAWVTYSSCVAHGKMSEYLAPVRPRRLT
jgi:hypothetical protein